MNKSTDLILPHGGYRRLRSFAVALAAYDGTLIFCQRLIDKRSRTHEQMVQAARSGVQNIAEGSLASGTSKKFELKLTGVARASLGELIRDYEDYLRQNHLSLWDKDSRRVRAMRARLAGKLEKQSDRPDPADRPERAGVFDEPLSAALTALETVPAEVAANILLCLVHQASYLLKCQMELLESDFVAHGGFTERLYRVRTGRRGGGGQVRESSDQSDQSDQSVF